MKFVAHDATICRDVIANRPLYVETLEAVISDNDLSDEKRAGANGFLKYMADDEFIANLTFLAGVTRLLKRFSTEFQVTITCLKNYFSISIFALLLGFRGKFWIAILGLLFYSNCHHEQVQRNFKLNRRFNELLFRKAV